MIPRYTRCNGVYDLFINDRIDLLTITITATILNNRLQKSIKK